jgi:hypothetical protein
MKQKLAFTKKGLALADLSVNNQMYLYSSQYEVNTINN